MTSACESSSDVNVTFPEFYYLTKYTALGVGKSREENLKWWKENKSIAPFDEVVADRNDGAPNTLILRVCLDSQNKGRRIHSILKDAGLVCKDVPSKL